MDPKDSVIMRLTYTLLYKSVDYEQPQLKFEAEIFKDKKSNSFKIMLEKCMFMLCISCCK